MLKGILLSNIVVNIDLNCVSVYMFQPLMSEVVRSLIRLMQHVSLSKRRCDSKAGLDYINEPSENSI